MRSRRLLRCLKCRSARDACLCDVATPIDVRSAVRVLVHHYEARKTTNTGRLAALTLGASYELWGDPSLPPPVMPSGRVLLLFPSDDARLLRADDAVGAPVLVVPDGNWPQARKIAHRVHDACGDRVVRVRIAGESTGEYGLRRTERRDALSTFEAIAHALAILEGDDGPGVLAASRALFAHFVARQTRSSQRVRSDATTV